MKWNGHYIHWVAAAQNGKSDKPCTSSRTTTIIRLPASSVENVTSCPLTSGTRETVERNKAVHVENAQWYSDAFTSLIGAAPRQPRTGVAKERTRVHCVWDAHVTRMNAWLAWYIFCWRDTKGHDILGGGWAKGGGDRELYLGFPVDHAVVVG